MPPVFWTTPAMRGRTVRHNDQEEELDWYVEPGAWSINLTQRHLHLLQLGSSSSSDDYVILGENQRISLHPHTTHTYAYLLDMNSSHSFLVHRVADEPNAIRRHWVVDRFTHLRSPLAQPKNVPNNFSNPAVPLVHEYLLWLLDYFEKWFEFDASHFEHMVMSIRVVAYAYCTTASNFCSHVCLVWS